jgi:hypothetical protein
VDVIADDDVVIDHCAHVDKCIPPYVDPRLQYRARQNLHALAKNDIRRQDSRSMYHRGKLKPSFMKDFKDFSAAISDSNGANGIHQSDSLGPSPLQVGVTTKPREPGHWANRCLGLVRHKAKQVRGS